jgi:putative colanic acid biosynthesis acetyltransferase WcaF
MNLAQFSSRKFDRGRSSLVEAAWMILRVPLFASFNPFNAMRVSSLRLFGARIGAGVVVKPGVKVKFPWRLSIGDHSWIGEDVWIDNLDVVSVGANSVISQGTYLCTGNHDWKKETFDLVTAPIEVGNEVWIAAKSVVGPGVVIADRSIVTMGAVVTHSVPSGSLCTAGKPLVTPRLRESA